MLNFWTGGGAIELVLETPKLARSLLMAISTSVPIFIISYFPFIGLPQAPFAKKKNLTGIRSNIAASSDAGAKPGKSGKGGAERGRAKRQ